MNKAGRRLVIAAIVVVIFIVLSIVNLFVYPFKSSQPNFADVERVFSKIEIPADWVEISSSENSGIAGRACPIESDGCFSMLREFTVPDSTSEVLVAGMLEKSGCQNVSYEEHSPIGGDKYTTFICTTNAIRVEASLNKNSQKEWTTGIVVSSD